MLEECSLFYVLQLSMVYIPLSLPLDSPHKVLISSPAFLCGGLGMQLYCRGIDKFVRVGGLGCIYANV